MIPTTDLGGRGVPAIHDATHPVANGAIRAAHTLANRLAKRPETPQLWAADNSGNTGQSERSTRSLLAASDPAGRNP
jgi:hypothetical protein